MDCYDELATAIIVQTAREYIKALCEKAKCETIIKECREFFKGDDFSLYTPANGTYILGKLDEAAKKGKYNFDEIFIGYKTVE